MWLQLLREVILETCSVFEREINNLLMLLQKACMLMANSFIQVFYAGSCTLRLLLGSFPHQRSMGSPHNNRQLPKPLPDHLTRTEDTGISVGNHVYRHQGLDGSSNAFVGMENPLGQELFYSEPDKFVVSCVHGSLDGFSCCEFGSLLFDVTIYLTIMKSSC